MPYSLDDKLVIGISSRALFDLREADEVYLRDGLAAYRDYQRAREGIALSPGTGFGLVKALLNINQVATKRLVEVILMSRNDAGSSVRIFDSCALQDVDMTRGALTGGADPWPHLEPFHASLFLSAEATDVVSALGRGFPAALVLSPPAISGVEDNSGVVRIAFDGDAVLFDDEAERIFQSGDVAAFVEHEVAH